jgi:N-succinyldiaminopimelate aminotransferase
MPRYPSLSAPAEALPSSMFARLYERAERCTGPIIPFQIGDTHLAPPEMARLGNLGFDCNADPLLYGYSKPAGDSALLEALVDKLHRKNGMSFVKRDNVQITNGATHALSCATRSALDPGDEILLLAPYWPLIRGISASLGARPVECTFSYRLFHEPGVDIEALLEDKITRATAALYLTTPNNPDGKVLSRAHLEAVARVAERHDLWVLSDEAYEEYTFDGREHSSIATLPGMAERTLTAFTFSKTYAQAGLRLGYLVGPTGAIDAARKMANHSVYSVARALQRSALRSLEHGDAFIEEARQCYQAARDRALSRVQAPCAKPEGCTYLFLDLREWVDEQDETVFCLLEQFAEQGVLLAPGGAFGHEFPKWARLCYTAVTAEQLDDGIDRINSVLDRIGRAK